MNEPGADGNPAKPPQVAILGVNVSVTTFVGATRFLAGLVERRAGAYVSCANAYSVTKASEDPDYERVLNNAAFVMADGMSIVWALRSLGYRAERVHGDDLFLACCREFPKWRHFFVGGRTGQGGLVAEELQRRFPGIRIAGWHATPVRPVPEPETRIILNEIRDAQPHVVWVGMGTLAQDEWMTMGARRTGLPMVGVGSSFDLLSGRTRAAPEWVKGSGLQWLFRLAQEPRRLMYRYLRYNLGFVLGFSRQFAEHAVKRYHSRAHVRHEPGRND